MHETIYIWLLQIGAGTYHITAKNIDEALEKARKISKRIIANEKLDTLGTDDIIHRLDKKQALDPVN